MGEIATFEPGIGAFRPYLPAKDYATSLAFYEAIGFVAYVIDAGLAELSLGATPSCCRTSTSPHGPRT